jgi:cell wall-associated NlpC family hydrolase
MGPETRSALRRFQREHGLSADGHVGPLTRTALGVGRTAAGTTGTTAPASAPAAAPTARTGSVADVQRKLGVDADGVMGPVTRRAVSTFQSANGLPATGRLDRSTRTAILQGPDGTATTRTVSVSDDGSATPAPAAPSGPGTGASAAVESARAQLGKPYRSAGKGPDGFDCSGLTAYVFNAAGVSLGSSSYSQYGQGTSVQRSEIQPGDLVFFDSNGSGASHVGIATSPTTMISATSHGVKENSFTSGYWAAHYVGARRVA